MIKHSRLFQTTHHIPKDDKASMQIEYEANIIKIQRRINHETTETRMAKPFRKLPAILQSNV